MKKRRVLIPIDGSEKSLESLDYLKEYYNPEKVEIILLHVREIVFIDGMAVSDELRDAELIGKRILDKASRLIEEYDYKCEFLFGYAADEILNYAEENDIDVIVMAKNTQKKFVALVGSVTAHVAKKTKCTLVIVPEV
ncbi:universal stress protein [Clostridium thermobutyricum]|uniref:Universal stress protein family protein n=1 Tax=Clostridium thermobutyricum DSM 4928 TaxID=1121339 RepID=A0A1V4SZ60_9CLOT|nr:universal stress protein [Clostridium thermobutyricum]OPX49180.1 universal stress protein family protein [Clostridium thermobutyricum DSM 4928]